MNFAIITPSFNQLPYLKRCIASVRDQVSPEGDAVDSSLLSVDKVFPATRQLINPSTQHAVSVHHHIQDGGSTDGTVKFLNEYVAKQPSTNNYQLTFASEADEGMYDALNKGISFALQTQVPDSQQRTTDNCRDGIIAWLNCDEQYLPGTLSFVCDWFMGHSKIDLLSGGALLIRPDGSLLAFRKAYPLRQCYIAASHLYNLSCGMFFRQRAWEKGVHFDISYRNLGDHDWIMRLLQNRVRGQHTTRFLSAFCFTGQNMSQSEEARREYLRLQIPVWARLLRGPLNLLRLAEKVLCRAYDQRPFDYAVYSDGNAVERTVFHIEKASSQWPENE